MLGLPGFTVLDAHDPGGELVVTVETAPEPTGCSECGVVAVAHDRMPVEYRDLPAFGRPVRLIWLKRRWSCEEPECPACTWTETSPLLSVRCLLTRRAALECCLEVGLNARPVAQLARALGVAWHTVMNAVREYGQALIDDPDRVGQVRKLGVDTDDLAGGHPRAFDPVRDEPGGSRAAHRHRRRQGQHGQRSGFLVGSPAHPLDAWRAGRGHGPGRVLPLGARRAPGSRNPGRRSLPRGEGCRSAPSTRCAAGCRTAPSGIAAESAIPCTGSESSCSQAPSAWMAPGSTGCFSGF